MRTGTTVGLVTLGLITSLAHSASGQDIVWIQPYSGNTVYGPFSSSAGEIPNCPQCECEICQPSGCRGLFKRFWEGLGDKFRRDRREYYYCKQTYHTLYTPPVLPPYCEPGFGYYETTWRQPLPCDPTLGYSIGSGLPHGDDFPPAPAPMDPDSPSLNPAEGKGQEAPGDSREKLPNGQQEGKPPYEESPPTQTSAQWKPAFIQASDQSFPPAMIIPKR